MAWTPTPWWVDLIVWHKLWAHFLFYWEVYKQHMGSKYTCKHAEKEQEILVSLWWCHWYITSSLINDIICYLPKVQGRSHVMRQSFSPQTVITWRSWFCELEVTVMDVSFMSMKARLTFLCWKSYFTQCWKPLPFDLRDVTIKQLPTKCAE